MKLTKAKNGTYKVHISTDYGPRTVGTGARSREEAIAIVRDAKVADMERTARTVRLSNEIVNQLRFGKSIETKQALSQWEEFLITYSKSGKTTLNKLITVRAWLRDNKLERVPIHSIKPQQIDQWINDPQSKDKAGTRTFKLSCLRSYFSFCTSREFILSDPTKAISVRLNKLTHRQKEPAKVRAFTETVFNFFMAHIGARMADLERERDRLIELLDAQSRVRVPTIALEARIEENYEARRKLEFWRVAALIGRHTGLRLGDVCRLEADSVTDTPGRLVVWTGKTQKRVSLPLPPDLRKSLAAHVLAMDKKQPFCFPQEAAIYTDERKRPGLSVAFSRLCDAGGARGMGFHNLRSTYAHECRAAGIPTPHIAERLGHSHTATTDIYLQ